MRVKLINKWIVAQKSPNGFVRVSQDTGKILI